MDQFAFDVRRDVADVSFVAAFMRSDTFLSRSAVVTTTGQLPRISIDEILSVRIDVPPTVKDQSANCIKSVRTTEPRPRTDGELRISNRNHQRRCPQRYFAQHSKEDFERITMAKKKAAKKNGSANGNGKRLNSQQSVNGAVKSICDIMRRSNSLGRCSTSRN